MNKLQELYDNDMSQHFQDDPTEIELYHYFQNYNNPVPEHGVDVGQGNAMESLASLVNMQQCFTVGA